MKSTSGLSIWPRNWRAYADSDSTYRRWPSAKIVSNASDDLPDPESPVNTIRESRGRSSETSLRLCSRAPRMMSWSATDSPRFEQVFVILRGPARRLDPGHDRVAHDLTRHRQPSVGQDGAMPQP